LKIAFLGIGLMGRPMVANLIGAGFDLVLWNRTPSKMACFKNKAEIAETPVTAVENADVVISMLENGDVVDEVLIQQDVLNACQKDTLIIDMSSIPPATAKTHAAYCASKGLGYLDAPVSGGTVGAEQATLAIMAGGDASAYAKAKNIFTALGRSTYMGPAGTGQITKLANQAIVGITIGAVAEAMLLAAKGGADPVAVREALNGGFASSRILDLHGQRMIDRNFVPGATSRVQLKDLKNILKEAEQEGLNLPLSQRVFEEYTDLVAAGYEEVDHSGLLLELERKNHTKLSNAPDHLPNRDEVKGT
jgi:2-hydroxy-3-oxopropionate reductase